MIISKNDYKKLCKIAKMLNDTEHEDYDYDLFDIWEDLNEIINNIKE